MLWEIANAHRGSVTSVYADANYVLSGGEDGAVRVWARTNRKLLIQFNGNIMISITIYNRLKKRYCIIISRPLETILDSFMFNG